MESLSQTFMPSPYGSKTPNGQDISLPIFIPPQQPIICSVQSDEHLTPLRRLPLEGPFAADKSTCDREVTHQSSITQHHTHSAIYCGGDDFTCKNKLPRPLVWITQFLPESQMVMLRRTGLYLTPFIYCVMLSSPFNMASYVMCDASRFLRERDQWQMLMAEGVTKVGCYKFQFQYLGIISVLYKTINLFN